MREFFREHGWAVVLSALLHGALVGGLVVAAVISTYRKPPSVQPLPIDAVVVSPQVVHALRERAEQEAARARAAEEAKAAAAKAAEQEKAAQEAKTAEDAKAAQEVKAAEEAKAAQEAKAAEDAKAAKLSAATKAEAQKAEARGAAEARRAAEADLAEQAKRAADARKAAEAKLTADTKQAAEAKQVADAKRAADDRARQDREAELRKQLADEEHRSAVESGPARDSYIARIRNKIQAAWIKPPSAGVGLDCQVELMQVAGGEVTSARVTQCNGDAAVRQSIENAVYRASPLPEPPDPALFDRHVVIRFKPDE